MIFYNCIEIDLYILLLLVTKPFSYFAVTCLYNIDACLGYINETCTQWGSHRGFTVYVYLIYRAQVYHGSISCHSLKKFCITIDQYVSKYISARWNSLGGAGVM